MKDIIFNENIYIALDIMFGSIMAFFAVIAFGKRRSSLETIFFVLSAIFLYLSMAFRVLKKINIFSLSDFLINNIALFEYLVYYLPSIFFTVAFVFVLLDRKR